MNSKKIISSLLSVTMVASMAVPAYAAAANEVTGPLPNSDNTKVTLEVQDTGSGEEIIIATVPAELPIVMDLEGNITVPSDAKIINHSIESNLEVTSIDVSMEPDWAIADFGSDFTAKPDNTKELGLAFRGDELQTTGKFSLTDGNWVIAKNEGELPLDMETKLPKQSEQAKTQIATVQFTLDLEKGQAPTDDNPSNGLILTEEEAKVEGFTFSTYQDGVQIHNFYNRQSKTEINVPEQIGDFKVLKISNGAFNNSYCRGITSITIPDSVTSIADEAFRDCTSLTSITIPDSVTTIGKYAFHSCTSLSSVTLPDSLTYIGNYAFGSCTSFTSVTLPDSLTEIDDFAFSGCTSLTSVTIPNSVTEIRTGAFQGCTGLTSVTIPDSITSISNQVFHSCTSLASVTIPDSVTFIDNYAFYGCTGLTSVTIPNSVTSISISAFINVPHIEYHGSASGAPWGAKSIN